MSEDLRPKISPVGFIACYTGRAWRMINSTSGVPIYLYESLPQNFIGYYAVSNVTDSFYICRQKKPLSVYCRYFAISQIRRTSNMRRAS